MLGPSHRPPLPTSSSAFALPSTSSLSSPHTTYAQDDLSQFMASRLRRPSLLASRAPLTIADTPLRSPLATSVLTRRSSTNNSSEESESDRENVKMIWTDSPSSGDSGATTPLLMGPSRTNSTGMDSERDQENAMKTSSASSSRPRSPSAPPMPPRDPSLSNSDIVLEPSSSSRRHSRRLSHNVKAPRIRSLISESRPEENEVRSEAQFQRLVASRCDLPSVPKTPRAPSDRGRYPEEADTEEPQREDTPSDDDGDFDDSVPFSYVEPIGIAKPVTPAQSVNGDDIGMLESPGGMAMDIDVASSMGSPIMSSWRHTPPPTSSVARNNKRKLDDRYDPYPTTKRRAVSPSISHLRESQLSLFNPRTPVGTPRLVMPTPIPIPTGPSSATSSPIVGPSSYFCRGPHSALSSPTLRAQMLSSPVLRPILPRPRRQGDMDREEREIDGAGEGVGDLTLA